MGLNIGIKVTEQRDGCMEEGRNPKGTMEEIEKRFFDFLNNKFPKGGFCRGGVTKENNCYIFDVRMTSYASVFKDMGHSQGDMYLAIIEFIFKEFSHLEGIQTKTYWSG